MELGFRHIAIKPVRCGPGAAFGVTEETAPAFCEGYSRLTDLLFADLTEGTGEAFGRLLGSDPFVTTIRRVATGRSYPLRCPAGRNMIAVTPDGRIYPCDATAGYDDVCLGSVATGIDAAARNRVIHCYVNVRPACRACWARLICGGACHHTALLAGGFEQVDPAYCTLVRHMIQEAIWLVHALREHGTAAYGRLCHTLGLPRELGERCDDLHATRTTGR